MSTPVEPTITQTTSLASVNELVAQAERLGLVWSLRSATVVDTLSGGSPYDPVIKLDGDDDNTFISATSWAGPLTNGMRVHVVHVPPLGNYVVAVISTLSIQRYEIGARTSHGTTITTTEAVMETFTSFKILGGAAYRYEIDGALLAAATTFTKFRIRQTNTAGQSLGASDYWPGIGLGNAPFRHVGYFRSLYNTTVTVNLVLTAVTNSSTSTWVADAETPRYVSIRYDGPAIEYPSAVALV